MSTSGIEPTAAEGLFRAAAAHLAEDDGWELYVDPRPMDSVRAEFDPELDSRAAPLPHFAQDPRVSRHRARELDRAGIRRAEMDGFVACTPYMGGIPIPSAEDDPVYSARRKDCLTRARTAVASFGVPRIHDEGNGQWSIRVYFLTPVSRAVYDLFFIRADNGWQVVGRKDILDISM
jgi:hypothetical protein